MNDEGARITFTSDEKAASPMCTGFHPEPFSRCFSKMGKYGSRELFETPANEVYMPIRCLSFHPDRDSCAKPDSFSGTIEEWEQSASHPCGAEPQYKTVATSR